MIEVITRRVSRNKYWFTTNSTKTFFTGYDSPQWSNTFYLHFCKDNYPLLKYPELVDGHFNYFSEHDLHFNFHKGITFYEETLHIESGKTYAKIGCDFQHLHDQEWWMNDSGEKIMNYQIEIVEPQFLNLIRSKGY